VPASAPPSGHVSVRYWETKANLPDLISNVEDPKVAEIALVVPDRDLDCTILAAQVTGAHGVSGNVRLRLIGGNSEVSADALRHAAKVQALREQDGFVRRLELLSLRKQVQPKGGWIARFKDVTDRPAAESLFGCQLLVPETSLPKLPEGEFYVDQLLGLAIVTDTGRSLGNLTEVLSGPANDVYVTSAGAMIPAVSAFILSVDLDAARIVVTDVPGLLDAS